MKTLGIILVVVGLFSFIGWGVTRSVSGIQFDRKCGGYLKRAADANTIDLAKKELQTAISYAEKEELTEGYTKILYQTPKEDLGFWYKNIKSSLEELQQVSPDTTKLERTNILMKLRETLLDQSGSSTSVTVPAGISIYPYNALFCVWAWSSLFILGIGIFVTIKHYDD